MRVYLLSWLEEKKMVGRWLEVTASKKTKASNTKKKRTTKTNTKKNKASKKPIPPKNPPPPRKRSKRIKNINAKKRVLEDAMDETDTQPPTKS